MGMKEGGVKGRRFVFFSFPGSSTSSLFANSFFFPKLFTWETQFLTISTLVFHLK
jgi:hypothetical protein